jgi:hypothetical protein
MGLFNNNIWKNKQVPKFQIPKFQIPNFQTTNQIMPYSGRRGHQFLMAPQIPPQRKANPLTGDFNSSSRQSSDFSEHPPMFTCFFVALADILNAVCQVPKKKPASFKKIFRWFISHHRPDSVWKKDAKVPHKRKLPSTFSIDKALA